MWRVQGIQWDMMIVLQTHPSIFKQCSHPSCKLL